jgi:hypothetical protein
MLTRKLFNVYQIDLPTEKELNAFNKIFLSLEALNDFLKLSSQISKNCFLNQLIHKHLHMSDYIFMRLTLKDSIFMLEAEDQSTVIDMVKNKMNTLIKKHQENVDNLKKKATATKSRRPTKTTE